MGSAVVYLKGDCDGMVTLPIEVRRRLKISKGDRTEFIPTDEAILVLPMPRIEELFGSDPSMREVASAISTGRREEIEHESTE